MALSEWIGATVGRAHDPADNANGGELGIDLATPLHTPITTPFAGTVTYAGGNDSTGGIVKIASNIPGLGQAFDYFLHLDSVNVRPGQQVSAGQVLGLSGGDQPGAGGWPHVEYGVFTDPKYATQYWGFQSGSTLDPTRLVNYLASGAANLPGILGGGGSPTANAAASGSGWTQTQVSGNGGGLINVNVTVGSILDSIMKGLGLPNVSDALWMGGLIVLGGLLILAGVVVAILPNRQQLAQVAPAVAGAV